MANEEMNKEVGKPCEAFSFSNPRKAYEHMKYRVVTDFGRSQYGHSLYTWDDGRRFLAQCRNCGGYILIQSSEYHSFTDSPDDYYTDFFPVSSLEETDELNRKYSGFAIEEEFRGRFLMETNGRISWAVRE